MISLRLLFALNDFDSAGTIRDIAAELESGVIEVARSNGDTIESLTLTPYGQSLLPAPLPKLPMASA